jgi:hypothetical protein
MIEACDTVPADGCCGVIPCKLCLTYLADGDDVEDTQEGIAEFADSQWTGGVAGITFVSYWERNEYGVCEYVVELNGVEVYRENCGGGASCRDPAGSVVAAFGYDAGGTLTWAKHEPRELKLITDPDTGCRVTFCGGCRCSCRVLCVDVAEVLPYGTGYDDFIDTYTAELIDVAADCDPPVWEGDAGLFHLSLALGRDDYGNCIITPTVDDVEMDPVATVGCKDMTATIELEDGTTFTVRCKQCHCPRTIGDCICGRPMGEILRLVWSSANGTHGSASRTFDLTYGMIDEDTIVCSPWSPDPFPGYRGSVTGTFPMPMGGVHTNTLEVILVCMCTGCEYCVYYRWLEGPFPDVWIQRNYTVLTCECPAIVDVIDGFDQDDGFGHQVFDITIYELEENCT